MEIDRSLLVSISMERGYYARVLGFEEVDGRFLIVMRGPRTRNNVNRVLKEIPIWRVRFAMCACSLGTAADTPRVYLSMVFADTTLHSAPLSVAYKKNRRSVSI